MYSTEQPETESHDLMFSQRLWLLRSSETSHLVIWYEMRTRVSNEPASCVLTTDDSAADERVAEGGGGGGEEDWFYHCDRILTITNTIELFVIPLLKPNGWCMHCQA
jgi:hypothetical protein